jgi:hypothetical protein
VEELDGKTELAEATERERSSTWPNVALHEATRYASIHMAAKVSDRVQQLVTQAAELPLAELVDLAEAIDSLLHREETVAERHAVIGERIARVHWGQATTLSIEEVERTVRDELDF